METGSGRGTLLRTGVNPKSETVEVATLFRERSYEWEKRRMGKTTNGKYPRAYRERVVERMKNRDSVPVWGRLSTFFQIFAALMAMCSRYGGAESGPPFRS
jgi:hypothetical protein